MISTKNKPNTKPNKPNFGPKTKVNYENKANSNPIKANWTKPLRGSVSPDLIYNVKALNLFIALDNIYLMILLR